MSETEWWNNLQGDDITDNAYGVPPYNVSTVADIIEAHIKFDGGMILDFGCGPGRLGHELARRHPTTWVCGVDESQQMLELSRVDAPLNWTVGHLDLPKNWFGGGYAVTVFQHLPHEIVRKCLKQIYRAMKPESQFIFTYAVGAEDTFLNHQVSHATMGEWLSDVGFVGLLLDIAGSDWTWAVAHK